MVFSINPADSVRARYVFSVDGTVLAAPLENATIRFDSGTTIVDRHSRQADIDLGNVAIIPALVNAHTHLEFSALAAPLPRTANDTFAQWIAAVVEWRDQRDATHVEAHALAVGRGYKESLACGVCHLGEIATDSAWPDVYHEHGFSGQADDHGQQVLTGVRFREFLGLSAERAELLSQEARRYLALATPHSWRAGISPHAPYTVRWTLVGSMIELSRQYRAPLAIHLAETPEELELLSSHDGPLVEFLQQKNVWDPEAIPRGLRPIDYLKKLSTADRTLIIHGNYLMPHEWDFLAKHAAKMSVVYCPRTFHYFGHRDYPLEQMLAAGVHTAIGTDSRASNPDLDLFEELRFMRRQHPRIPAREILKLGTENGAKALGIQATSLSAIELPNRDSADPFALLFDDDG